jgi:hypothetical protein
LCPLSARSSSLSCCFHLPSPFFEPISYIFNLSSLDFCDSCAQIASP